MFALFPFARPALAVTLVESFLQLMQAVAQLVVTFVWAALPWTPLLLWVVFWLLAVNWRKLTPILWEQGGVIAVLLIAAIAILVWSSVSIPEGGMHHLLGLHVHNVIGKFVYVTGLIVIAVLCGTIQNSGLVNCCSSFDEIEPAEERGVHGHSDHGHSDHSHGDHSHGDHH